MVAVVMGLGLALAACAQTSSVELDLGAAPSATSVPNNTPVPVSSAVPAPTATVTPTPTSTPVPLPWVPAPGTTFQWQLSGELDISIEVDAYDIDLFDVSIATIQELHDAGRRVICYFSAGSWEQWRSDAGEFPEDVLGEGNGWPGER